MKEFSKSNSTPSNVFSETSGADLLEINNIGAAAKVLLKYLLKRVSKVTVPTCQETD